MEIINKKVDELIPYINNPRHNEQAIDALASSIKNFGFKVPIVVDKNNEIVTGHTRLKAAKKLGLEEVPVLIADDLTEEQVKAFRLADNKVGELATWDEEALQVELDALLSEEFDMSEYGFTEEDFQEVENQTEEDDYDEEVPEEPQTKYGQVYQLGNHRLMVGDSTKEEDVAKLMGGEKLNLLLTDPPYNVAYEGGTKDKLTIQNDSMDDAKFRLFLTDAFQVANSVMEPGAAFYIWHADSEGFNFRTAVKETGWLLKQTLIWVKSSIVLGRQDYQWIHEPCLYGWKDGAAHYFTFDRTQATVIEDKPNLNKMSKDKLKDYILSIEESQGPTTIIREKKPTANKEHPTMKPIKLLSRQVMNSSKKGQNVGDFFGGSGSTLITCEQLERNCFTMELDPRYADVIINRWENLTGETAVKISD
ncbi:MULTISPECIES: DNA modification methylase [Vagococcus]|uniref:DNA modification methylase n=1 Tax=Vagococcus TaxID=2737 RepID=UPI000E4B2822|nr:MULTISPECIES: DNA modification methylase [Vagococcus]RHH70108.1 DNA modification methylase [Vagococcus sp. AM17-17]